MLQPGESPRDFDTVKDGQGNECIRNRDNGDCIYLRRGFGCTIWDKPPQVCYYHNCYKYVVVNGHQADEAEKVAAERIGRGLTGLGNDRA